MFSLRLFAIGQSTVRLPCPVRDLLEVCSLPTVIAGDLPNHHLIVRQHAETGGMTAREYWRWGQLLRTSPALFLLAASGYHRQCGKCARDSRQLILWSAENLAGVLSKKRTLRRWRRGKTKPSAYCRTSRRWWTAKSNKQMRRALAAMMGNDQSTAKNVKRIVGKSLSPVDFFPGTRVDLTGGVWKKADFLPAPVSPKVLRRLLNLSVAHGQFESEFEARLQSEKLDAMKQLAYGASHEINNPLANIATGAQVLIGTESNCDRKRRLARIYAQAMVAHDMISDMMLFAHPPLPVFEQANVRLLVREIVRRHDADGQLIRVTMANRVDQAQLDVNQVSIALEALLKNARQAIREREAVESAAGGDGCCYRGAIELRVSVQGDRLLFRVSDNGAGFDEQAQRHLFDPFFSGREAGRGHGFGLSKAWRIIKLHQGDITAARDTHTNQTVFTCWLPITQASS